MKKLRFWIAAIVHRREWRRDLVLRIGAEAAGLVDQGEIVEECREVQTHVGESARYGLVVR
jgi:hypothetical protein